MRLLRVLFFVEAHYRFSIAAKCIPEPNNTLADHLSTGYSLPCIRWHISSLLILPPLFYSG